MSQSSPAPASGGGIMRSLAKGASASGFSGIFVMTDLIFHPSQTQARAHREEARRRRVAVPAPGDPPSVEHAEDAAVAIPAFLFEPLDAAPDAAEGPDDAERRSAPGAADHPS